MSPRIRVTEPQPLRPGHWGCLAALEQPSGYLETRALYAQGIPKHGVYLRPTDNGFTVLSLDYEACRSMVGVGRSATRQHLLIRLPPTQSKVDEALLGYHDKIKALARRSVEECYALELLSAAFQRGLALPWQDTFFLHQEWRLPSGNKIDLLAVSPEARSLVVIELKDSEASAKRRDAKKGGTALEQASAYAAELHGYRRELYPYFERLSRALARHHGSGEAFQGFSLEPDHMPAVIVSWPGERSLASSA